MDKLKGTLTEMGSLKGTLSGTGSLRGTLSGGGVGHGIPSGGEPGQGLIKVSDTDYDVKWMSILPEDTASGSVASFPDGADDLPMGVVVDIDPVQDLHGYDNPWPGGGGKNLYDKNAVENNKWIDVNATTISTQNGYAVSDFIPVVENQVYYMQAKGSARSAYYDENKNGIEYFTYSGGTSFVAAHTGYVRFTMRNYEALPYLQFEKGSAATAYEPYSNICPISGWTKATISHSGADTSNPTEHEIPFSTEVYGGTLNVVTGELVVDRAETTIGALSWTYSTSYKHMETASLVNVIKAPLSNGTVLDGLMSSAYTPRAAVHTGSDHINGSIGVSTQKNILVLDKAYTDVTSWLTDMGQQQIVYPLATPITLTLDPVEIRSLLGDNNVWADTGDVSVTYKADIKKYIDKKISAAVAAMS